MEKELKKVLLNHINEFKVEEYKGDDDNQIVTMAIRTLSEEVDEKHRLDELVYLAKCFGDPKCFDKSKIWVVKYNNKIYGYVSLKVDDKVYGKKEAWINGLYVDHFVRNLGLATKLSNAVLEYCKEIRIVVLKASIAAYSKNVVNSYEKLGFSLYKTENDGLLIYFIRKIIDNGIVVKTLGK